MTLSIVLEARFAETPDGVVWTKSVYPHAFWKRYLSVFDAVRVIARVEKVSTKPRSCQEVTGPGVSVVSVPNYIGPLEYALRRSEVIRAVTDAFRIGDVILLRVPSQLSNILVGKLRRKQYPFGLEVVGDPHDAFSPGAVRHPLRPLFRAWFTKKLTAQCGSACAVAYVTERILEQQYPPCAFTTFYSNVELHGDAFRKATWVRESAGVARLLFVGSLAQMYKGPDVLLRAASRSISKGLALEITIIGDGKHRTELERLAQKLGLRNRVRFLGEISSGEPVRRELDRADLFVLPSRTEGMPRAMIEAMARGLPCIGTFAGGIVELLPSEDLVPPGHAKALSKKIDEVLRDPRRLQRMSVRNFSKAQEYREEILSERRVSFYSYLKDRTECFLRAQ
jgi:glycosyltransferase involved in cell wall biosynthesis